MPEGQQGRTPPRTSILREMAKEGTRKLLEYGFVVAALLTLLYAAFKIPLKVADAVLNGCGYYGEICWVTGFVVVGLAAMAVVIGIGSLVGLFAWYVSVKDRMEDSA